MGLEAAELARWTRFAAKGGIGKCIATCDCIAESSDDLMFLKDDEITVLYQIPNREGFFLGYCEGVVGRFSGDDVRFLSKLKKPVMTKRTSLSTAKSPSPAFSSSSMGVGIEVHSPSPTQFQQQQSQHSTTIYPAAQNANHTSVTTQAARRTSSPRVTSLERRVSNQQARVSSPLTHSHTGTSVSSSTASAASPQQHQPTPSMSYSSTSSAMSDDGVLGTPVFGIFPGLNLTQKGSIPFSQSPTQFSGTPSPRDAQFPSPPTRAVSLSRVTTPSSLSNGPSAATGPSQQVHTQAFTPQHSPPRSPPLTASPSSPPWQSAAVMSTSKSKYTTHAPSPLMLYPESNTSPLRIHKRSPTSPGFKTLALASPPPVSPLPDLPSSPPASSYRSPPAAEASLPSPLHATTSYMRAKAVSHALVGSSSVSSSIASTPLDNAFSTSASTSFGSPSTASSTPMSPAHVQRMAFSPVIPATSMNSTTQVRGRVGFEQEHADARAGVSIGLSLLQDLAEGMYSDSDSGSEYDDEQGDGGRMPAAGAGVQDSTFHDVSGGQKGKDEKSYAEALNRVGHQRAGSVDGDGYSDDGTMEGLRYARSEETHQEHEKDEEPANDDTQRQALNQRQREHEQEQEQHDEPLSPPASISSSPPSVPPTHGFLAFPTSPSSGVFPVHMAQDQRERRPSVAQSVHSNRSGISATSGSSSTRWDAAAEDIYDDYRYSRFSMMSKGSIAPSVTSKVSVGPSGLRKGSVSGGREDDEGIERGMGGLEERARVDSGSSAGSEQGRGSEGRTTDPQTRPSIDSMMSWVNSRGTGRERVDPTPVAMPRPRDVTAGPSARQRPMGMALTESPQMMLSDLPEEGSEMQDGGGRRDQQGEARKSRALLKERTASVDSDASVYTQNSDRLSTLSRDPIGYLESQTPSTTQNRPPPTESPPFARPAPLNLEQQGSPLLHTSWGSAASSAGFPYPVSPKNSAMFQSMASAVEAAAMGVEVEGQDVIMPQNEARVLSPPLTAGFASAMRTRLEEERKPPNPQAEHEGDGSREEGAGLGNRIVIEDDEELPSRVEMDSTFDSEADATFTLPTTPDTPSSHPEPELLGGLRQHLAPLVVTNRTPSPSIGERASEDGGGLSAVRERASPLPLPAIQQPSSLPPYTGSLPSSSPTPSSVSSPPSSSPSPSHLRPSLADLRAPGGAPVPGTNQRRSLFLPHPNAPKPPEGAVTSGPLFLVAGAVGAEVPLLETGQQTLQLGTSQPYPSSPPQLQTPQQQHSGQPPPRPNVAGVIRMALSMPPRPAPATLAQGPPGAARPPPLMRGPTIYGRTDTDLSAATGPVPILFSVDPPPRSKPPGQQQQQQGQQEAYGNMSPPRKQVISKSSLGQLNQALSQGQQQQRQPLPRSMSLGPGVVSTLNPSSNTSTVINSNPQTNPSPPTLVLPPSNIAPPVAEQTLQTAAGGALPRANFFPKAAGLRPRSRSFSGFNSITAGGVVDEAKRSRDETSILSSKLSLASLPPLSTSPSTSPSPSSTSPKMKSPSLSLPLRPSPLSLGSSTTSPTSKSPSSPLAQSMIVAPRASVVEDSNITTADTAIIPPAHQLRQISSRATLAELPPSHSQPLTRSTSALMDALSPPTFSPPAPVRTASLQLPANSSSNTTANGITNSPLLGQRRDMDVASISSSDSRSRQVVSPPPFASLPLASATTVVRQTSLRSKLSLPNLRRKQSRPDLVPSDDQATQHEREREKEMLMLQVQDMEFELVRPNLAQHFQAARTSEDSAVLGRDTASLDLRGDTHSGIIMSSHNSFLRAESPAFSIASGTGGTRTGSSIPSQSSPTIDSPWGNNNVNSSSNPATTAAANAESNMDAHRQRELKWMALMSANPASQARKSRKVRKLVLEGVPSSVRFLVWAYLADGHGHSVPGVYTQLCSRGIGRVPSIVESRVSRDIADAWEQLRERDGEGKHFAGGMQSPVGTLLTAYLNMVPDVQYSTGLTHIVGQLLHLSPEEDAFWIFVSVMDTHLRPYFSSTSSQMEVDATLFSRALEANEPQVARRLLVDVGLSPSSICQPWFSSLFVSALPAEHLNRVWDLFLFEGIPFLMRVALALMASLKRLLLAPMPLASSISASSSNSSMPPPTHTDTILALLRHPPHSALPPTPDAFLALVLGVKLKDDDVRKQRVKMEMQVKRQTAQQQQLQHQTAANSIQNPRPGAGGMISLPRAA